MSVSLWWFEVSKWSCPLKSFSEENTGRRPKLSRRKGGDRPGLTTATHCLHRPTFIFVCLESQLLHWFLKNVKSQARRSQGNEGISLLVNNTQRETPVCAASRHSQSTSLHAVGLFLLVLWYTHKTNQLREERTIFGSWSKGSLALGNVEKQSLMSGCTVEVAALLLVSLGLKEKEEAGVPLSHLRTNSK